MAGEGMHFFSSSLSQNCNEVSPKKSKQWFCFVFFICVTAGEENTPGKLKKMWPHQHLCKNYYFSVVCFV